jgi:plastocyanin
MKVNTVANIAKVGLASLVLVLVDAPTPRAMGETDSPLRGSWVAVTGRVRASASEEPSGVVVWLVPARTREKDRPAIGLPHYTIVQRNKTFEPRLLVIPAGSTVDFPNNDRWFHNVFSISRGRQFDLGLYEGGVLRSVRFDRAGVSYLFCSIHPEMMAVVVTVDSPYFGVSDKGGRIEIGRVPPGQYLLHVWRENVKPQALAAMSRLVFVGDEQQSLPPIIVPRSETRTTNGQNWM